MFIKDTKVYSRQGIRFLLDRTSLVDRRLMKDGFWEKKQIAYLKHFSEKLHHNHKLVFADIGSYFGLYALLALKWGYFNKIYAFEADRHNFAQLQANLFLNNATHAITAYNRAVSDCTAVLPFRDSRMHPSKNRGGVGIVDENSECAHYPTQATSIDTCLRLDDACVLIGKIDVEGHELKVMQGMFQTFASHKVFLQIEIIENEKQDATHQSIEKLGLRQIHKIGDDHFMTNIPPEELGV